MKRFFRILKTTAKEWNQDEAPRLAAALSYYMVFSLAPLLIFLISLLKFFLESQDVQARILAFFTEHIGPQSAETIESMLRANSQSGSLTLANIVGIGILLLTATTALTHLHAAFNKIWGVEVKPGAGIKAIFLKRLGSLALILVTGVLIMASFLLSTAVSVGIEWISESFPQARYLLPLSEILVSIGIMSLLFTLMFQYLPDVRLKWSHVWRGGVLTGILFFVGNNLITWYFSTGNVLSSYGAAGSLIAILLWIYYSSLILFFGAEFTYVWIKEKGFEVAPQSIAMMIAEKTGKITNPLSFRQKAAIAFGVIRKEIQFARAFMRLKKWPKKMLRKVRGK